MTEPPSSPRPPSPLPAVAMDLLGDYRVAQDLPPAARARIWARLQDDDAQPASSIAAPGSRAWLWPAVLAAAVVIGVSTWIVSHPVAPTATGRTRSDAAADERALDRTGGRVRDRDRSARTRSTNAVGPEASEGEAPSTLENAASLGPPLPTADPARTRPRAEPERVETEVERTSDLREERALVQRAWTALNQGEAPRAQEIAEEHARRFPRGVLAPEAAAIRTIARCDLDPARAAATADAFLRAHPRSPLEPRIRAACLEEK